MTDRSMDADATEHPDEGLIHAWLDDALSAAEGERLAAHVRGCAECQARVAEARGLIAGASRIVASLDDVPAGTRPGWAQSATSGGAQPDVVPITTAAERVPQQSLWRWLRVTPGRAALAATILVALGITLTHERVAEDSVRSVTAAFDPQRADAPAATPAEGAASDRAKEPPARDALLDSAVARNLAQTQGRARIEAAPGPAIPQAPPPSLGEFEERAGVGGAQVAAGRAAAEAKRETATVTADRLRVGNAAGASDASSVAAAATSRAATRIPSSVAPAAEGAMMARQSLYGAAGSCVRIDSPDGDARWADQPFPLVVAIDSVATGPLPTASVLTAEGRPTRIRATLSPRGADSTTITLRRIGYSGSIVLGPGGVVRSGIAVSATGSTALQQEVAVGAPAAESRARAEGARDDARKSVAAPQPAAAQPAPAPGPPIRQLRVTARTIDCPR